MSVIGQMSSRDLKIEFTISILEKDKLTTFSQKLNEKE